MTTGFRELPLPIRMTSDWHLGHPGSRIGAISQVEHLLEGINTLVMVGDGREELVKTWRQQADQLWSELQQQCERKGIMFVVLTGNHDPNASGEGWMRLQEGRILVTHGDMIYETSSPWSKELFAKREEVAKLLEVKTCECLEDRWRCAREVGLLLRPHEKMNPDFLSYLKQALWPPERLVEVGKVWAGFAKEGERFLEEFSPESDTLVCGHFHRPGKYQAGAKTVWNTGSAMKMSRGLTIDFDGEALSAERLRVKSSVPAGADFRS